MFLTSDPAYAPTALMHSLKHYKVLHEKNVILTIDYARVPRVDPAERVQITRMSERFSRIRLRFGELVRRPNRVTCVELGPFATFPLSPPKRREGGYWRTVVQGQEPVWVRTGKPRTELRTQ